MNIKKQNPPRDTYENIKQYKNLPSRVDGKAMPCRRQESVESATRCIPATDTRKAVSYIQY